MWDKISHIWVVRKTAPAVTANHSQHRAANRLAVHQTAKYDPRMSESSFDPVKWTISVPREMDIALRTHLAAQGAKKGDLSRFVAEAVRRQLFELNLAAAQAHNRDVPPEVLESEIDQALAEVRAGRFAKPL